MQTKIILSILLLITILWNIYKNNGKKQTKKRLITYVLGSIPVILYVIFGGGVWFYSFIGIIIWMFGFYFGEIVIWWGIWILTIGSTYWYLSILGPLAITFLPYLHKIKRGK